MQIAMKKVLAVILSLAFIISITACAQKQNPQEQSQAATTQQATTETAKPIDKMGKYESEIEITTVKGQDDALKFYDGEDFSNNAFTRAYLKDLGIRVKVLWSVPASQYEQRLNLSIASNEMPDICEVNDIQFSKLLSADMLQDMTVSYNDYITDYARSFMEGDGGVGMKKYTVGGKLMAVPLMAPTYDSAPMLWIRSDWMQKVGLQAPKTTDEFLALVDALTTKDPDGNGKADTLGFAFEKALFGEFATLNGYFNAFGAYPQAWVKDSSGNLAFGGIQPETKQALAKLADMFKAGSMDKEFGVKDGGKIAELITAGKLGMFYGMHWNAFWPLPDAEKNNDASEWLPYPLPSPDGSGSKPEVKIGVRNAFAISKNLKNPEAAIKMLNYFWDVDFDWSPNYTTAAFHFGYADPSNPKKADASKPNAVGFKAAVLYGNSSTQNIDMHKQYLAYQKSKNIADAPMLKGTYDTDPKVFDEMTGFMSSISAARTFSTADKALKDKYYAASLWTGTEISAYNIVKNYIDANQIVFPEFYGSPTATMSSKQATLDKLQLETYTKIIMGTLPLDGFDKFVEDWKALGGDQITTEVNDWAKSAK